MSQALSNLLALLDLEKIEEGLFRRQSEDLGLRQVFGGQVVGQALYAVKEIASVERLVHSFHSYFLHPDDSQKPIVYGVEVLRDGNSFSARRVAAIQDGKPILYMTAPFQAPEHGYEHQRAMLPAPSPDGLYSETDIARKLVHLLPPQVKDKFLCDKPLEIRSVEFHNPMRGHIAEPVHQVWLRVNGAVSDDLRIRQYLLGYTSDFNFLLVALQPHGVGFLESGTQVATTDRSMWFHRSFNINEWLSCSVEGTSTSSARGSVRDEFYTQDGTLMASAVREEVMCNRNA